MERKSIAFSTFRDLMDTWDENLQLERKEKVKSMIDNNLLFFFKKGKELFGCPEESRLIFAKLKNPDEDVTPSWHDEAAFLAYNLSRSLEEDEPPKQLFYKKDMDNLVIMDKETLEKLLLGKK